MHPLQESDLDCPFGDEAREQGRALFEEGKIRLSEQADAHVFAARVPFFRRFQTVTLSCAPGQAVEHHCTCSELANTGAGCQHLFGLLLAINDLLEEREQEPWEPLLPRYILQPGLGPLRLGLYELSDQDGICQPMAADGEHLGRVESESDRRILGLLAACAGGRRSLFEGGGFARPEGPWAIPAGQREALLELLFASQRFGLLGLDRHLQPLKPGAGRTCELLLAPRREGSSRCRLRGFLLLDGQDVQPLKAACVVVDDEEPWVAIGHEFLPLACHAATEWLGLLIQEKCLPAPQDEGAFLTSLASTGPLPRVWPQGAARPPCVVQGVPVPHMTLSHEDEDLVGTGSFLYGDRKLPFLDDGQLAWDAQEGRQWRRDVARERAWLAQLEGHGLQAHPQLAGSFLLEDQDPPVLARRLLEAGWAVALEGAPVRRATERGLVQVDRAGGFVLGGLVEFDGIQAPLADVLNTAPGAFVVLPGGDLGLLPESWDDLFRNLGALAEVRDGELFFTSSQGPLVEAALAGAQERRARLLSLQACPPRNEPPAFRGVLRDYQRQGLGWLLALEEQGLGGCLADEMGLGKTVQLIAFLQVRAQQSSQSAPTLLVCPRSLIFNWQEELERFAPELELAVHVGPGRAQAADDLARTGLILTTFGTLRVDGAWLEQVQFGLLVLDEAQAIKNPSSQVSRAARALRADQRVSLTGTPVENHLRDFWTQMEFLNPGLLGPQKRFLGRAGGPGAQEVRALVARATAPLLLRRTKEQVAPELPELMEQVLHAPLEAAQKALYEKLRQGLQRTLEQGPAQAGGRSSALTTLEGLLRLRQAACHPGLVDPALRQEPSGKLELLVTRLAEVHESGRKALVFSQFTSFLDLVQERLAPGPETFTRLDGKTRQRKDVVRQFQEDPRCNLLLASLKVGGVGLNLTAADHVFLLDPWWNPATEAQALGRAHRLGRKQRVMAFRLVSQHTVEERILELQSRKASLAREILDPQGSTLADLTQEDLQLLLGE